MFDIDFCDFAKLLPRHMYIHTSSAERRKFHIDQDMLPRYFEPIQDSTQGKLCYKT